jgi:hypothetical protein
LYILMMMMDNTTRECVNVCSFSSDILCEMSKKERDGISLLFSSLFFTKEREENKFNQWFAMLCDSIHGVINFRMMSVTARSSEVSGSHIYTDEK